jgi:Flp pilus assembly protein TadD
MRSAAFLVTVLFLSSGTALAQRGVPPTPSEVQPTAIRPQGSIRGRVILPGGGYVPGPVKVTVQSFKGNQYSFYTDGMGQFEIRNLNEGEYTVEVEGDRRLFDVTSESVRVYRGMPSIVTISLKGKSRPGPGATSGVVSIGELDKDVPPKARKEFDRASEASRGGKSEEAIEHLRKAIAIYPDFMMAHNDLGALLLEREQFEEAEKELRRAITLNGKAFNPQLNLGIVLIKQQRFSEAAETLKKALSLESNAPAARLYLGQALMGLTELDGAEKEMKAAYEIGGAPYAVALFYLGRIYMNKGNPAGALAALEAYLKQAPEAENAGEARRLIGILRQ